MKLERWLANSIEFQRNFLFDIGDSAMENSAENIRSEQKT